MKTLFKVVNQSLPTTVQKQDGSSISKCTIVLTEPGGKYENTFVCTLLGNAAQCRFYPNDLVWASLRFASREYQGNFYQDITVQDIISFSNH